MEKDWRTKSDAKAMLTLSLCLSLLSLSLWRGGGPMKESGTSPWG